MRRSAPAWSRTPAKRSKPSCSARSAATLHSRCARRRIPATDREIDDIVAAGNIGIAVGIVTTDIVLVKGIA